LLALEKLLATKSIQGVTLHSPNARLSECLESYCKELGCDFQWQRLALSEPVGASRRTIHSSLPPLTRAVISLGWFCVRRLPNAFHKSRQLARIGSISFFDVLVHLDKLALESGRFVSNYWGPLVDKLFSNKVSTNWFHHFYPHPAVPTFMAANRLVGNFRKNASGLELHGLIDVFPSVRTVLRAWRDYWRIRRTARAIEGFQSGVRPQGSGLNLWPLHNDEWTDSIFGPNALMECLRLGLFEALLAKLPHQTVGVYICENQPWELSLIHAWRNCGHGRLIAVPHSTFRYWDLRYFYDRRVYYSGKPSDMPLPDQYAVNGPVAKGISLAGGYPAGMIVEVEALRFMHLAGSRLGHSGQSATNQNSVDGVKKVLICGDFLSSTNARIFDWLHHIEGELPRNARFFFKPHPAFPYKVSSEFAQRIGLRVSERPLGELLQECDVVITSAVTSAAVDSYCSGKQVIQISEGRGLNVNALRGLAGVHLAFSPGDLANFLQKNVDLNAVFTPVHYFRLDSSLRGWWDVLALSESH
jgi:surface carbohydrate biosynthesis protein (TIGR04326 family)